MEARLDRALRRFLHARNHGPGELLHEVQPRRRLWKSSRRKPSAGLRTAHICPVRELRRAWLLPKFSKSDGSRRQRDPRPQRPQQPERQHRRRRLFQWWRAIRAEVGQLARAGFVVAQHAHHTPFFKCIAHGLDQLFGLLVGARSAGLRALSFIQHFLYVCGAVSADGDHVLGGPPGEPPMGLAQERLDVGLRADLDGLLALNLAAHKELDAVTGAHAREKTAFQRLLLRDRRRNQQAQQAPHHATD